MPRCRPVVRGGGEQVRLLGTHVGVVQVPYGRARREAHLPQAAAPVVSDIGVEWVPQLLCAFPQLRDPDRRLACAVSGLRRAVGTRAGTGRGGVCICVT